MIIPLNDLSNFPFIEWGKTLEIHPAFPSKTNVHFIKVISRDFIQMKVWEKEI